jgi:PTS system mannose-specific IIB component/fructoselysine and glucoselysine-specific PTS system IIB component
MSLVLVRLDDRYVHGQVVVGWGRALRADRILLVDDAVRASEWEQDLYRLGVPPEVTLEFASVAEAGARLRALAAADERVIVIVGDIETLERVLASHPPITELNIGGLHTGPGRRQRLPYVFLTDTEARALERLSDAGVVVSAQDVPTGPRVPLREFA